MALVSTVVIAGSGGVASRGEASDFLTSRNVLLAADGRRAIAAAAPWRRVLGRRGTLPAGGLLCRGDQRVGSGGVGGGGLCVSAAAGPTRGAAVGGPPLALVARKDGSVCTVTAGGEPV